MSELIGKCRICGRDTLHKKKKMCVFCQNLKTTMELNYIVASKIMEEIEDRDEIEDGGYK